MAEGGVVEDLLVRLGLSPSAAVDGAQLAARSSRIALVVVAALVLGRLGGRAVRRGLRSIPDRAPPSATSARARQRAATLGEVLAGVVRSLVAGVALLIVLDELGINLAPLLAGAGIAGLAVGFGAQSLVKDVLSGMFILAEDQYGVGDSVTVSEGVTGTVEDVTVRTTRVRDAEGTVWFVPNGEIRRVGNHSMEWSRAVVDIPVSYDADLAAVRGAMVEEATSLAGEERWAVHVLEAPELWGVQHVDASSVTLRLVVKTAPRQQYELARELRGRITERLGREGVRRPAQTALVDTRPARSAVPGPAVPPESP